MNAGRIATAAAVLAVAGVADILVLHAETANVDRTERVAWTP